MTKEFLNGYRLRAREATQIREQLDALAAEATAPRSPSLSGMPHGGDIGRPTEDLAVRIAEVSAYYDGQLAQLLTDRIIIEKAIATLEPRERMLIRARYLEDKRWEEVCLCINYSWPQTHRIHSAILRKLR